MFLYFYFLSKNFYFLLENIFGKTFNIFCYICIQYFRVEGYWKCINKTPAPYRYSLHLFCRSSSLFQNTWQWTKYLNVVMDYYLFFYISVKYFQSDSHVKKIYICFNDSPSKMLKNELYFILKALFVLKIFKFLS